MRDIKIAHVDDHRIFIDGLRFGLNEIKSDAYVFKSIGSFSNGEEFIQFLEKGGEIPDIVLMDVNMPFMDGITTTSIVNGKWPQIKVIGLSMHNNDQIILKMLQAGARGYLTKTASLSELQTAIKAVFENEYYSDQLTSKVMFNFLHQKNNSQTTSLNLTERETEFLKYCCSELSYKEIAEKMSLSPRTIDAVREVLFEKLGLMTRTGLVLYAIRNKIVEI
ncbi:MAG: response regulator transcription factor [Chitinophagaceae bacterium]|nr:MAG: response regulator transcription factor [Chitinophagaceae bacterium]